jgi:hypothetical protein
MVTRAISKKKPKTGLTGAGSNVIMLPVVHQGNAQLAQPMLFASDDLLDMPPWLVEDKPQVAAKPKPQPKAKAKRAPAKTAAKKRTVTKKAVAKKPARAKAKVARKAPAKTKPAQPLVSLAKAQIPAQTEPREQVAPQMSAEPLVPTEAQPLARSKAPVVWQKNSPLATLRYWLRSAGRSVLGFVAPAKPSVPKLRTRKQLLAEIAVLRQENSVLRKKLDLPAMPFGRTVADKL